MFSASFSASQAVSIGSTRGRGTRGSFDSLLKGLDAFFRSSTPRFYHAYFTIALANRALIVGMATVAHLNVLAQIVAQHPQLRAHLPLLSTENFNRGGSLPACLHLCETRTG